MMKLLVRTVLCLLVFHGVVLRPLQAAAPAMGAKFDVGPSLFWLAYDEPGVMKESGKMYGLQAAATLRGTLPLSLTMFRVEGLASRGSIGYTSFKSGDINGIDYYMYDARMLLGRDMTTESGTVVTPYIGFGYRRLNDYSGGLFSSKGSLGYDRESNYYYLPVGIGIGSGSDNGWRYEWRLEYDVFVRGLQKSALTQANSLTSTWSNDLANKQHGGYGLRLSARFIRKIRNASQLAFEPFLRYWSIDRSDPDGVYITNIKGERSDLTPYIEPANNTFELGLNTIFLF